MHFLQKLNRVIEKKGTQPQGELTLDQPTMFGNDVVWYPADNGERFVRYGYSMNDAVYSIVSKNAEKAAQIPFFVTKVKDDQKKTLQEYKALSAKFVGNEKEAKELHLMRKSMIDYVDYQNPLGKLLQKPNRNQSWNEFMENLFGLRELEGEGNIWFNKGLDGRMTLEMFAIPKPHLNLVGNGVDPWEIVSYQFDLNGRIFRWPVDQVLMWKYSNPCNVSTSLEHLRGLAPLQSAMVLLQGMNEGDKRLAASNKNAGAFGFAFNKTPKELSGTQKVELRNKFDNIVNAPDMAGKIAVLSGDWGYYNIGLSNKDQGLLEQYGYGFKRMCRVFKTPAGIFDEGNATWDNQKQFYRQWVYTKIAPNIYQLRSKLSDRLIPEFGLDPASWLIDCDIMALPEMADDLKDQIAAVQPATFLTDNEKRLATGYPAINDPSMDMTSRQAADQIGAGLDAQMNLLNQ
jgi:HK97 family phage portal protein